MGIHSRKLPVPRRFYNPSDIFSKLGLSRGRNLKVAAFEPLARGRVYKIILSQTNQTHTFHIQIKYV